MITFAPIIFRNNVISRIIRALMNMQLGTFMILPANGVVVAGFDIIIDNVDSRANVVGSNWTSSAAVPQFFGAGYIHDQNASKGTKSVTYSFNVTETGAHVISFYLIEYGFSHRFRNSCNSNTCV